MYEFSCKDGLIINISIFGFEINSLRLNIIIFYQCLPFGELRKHTYTNRNFIQVVIVRAIELKKLILAV